MYLGQHNFRKDKKSIKKLINILLKRYLSTSIYYFLLESLHCVNLPQHIMGTGDIRSKSLNVLDHPGIVVDAKDTKKLWYRFSVLKILQFCEVTVYA